MLAKKRNPDATAAMKALTLYSLLLFSGRRYSLTELTDLLGCSKPTVTRLLQQIEVTPGLHLKINVETEGRQHYYRAVPPDIKPNVSLQAKAIQDLALCRDMLTKQDCAPSNFIQADAYGVLGFRREACTRIYQH